MSCSSVVRPSVLSSLVLVVLFLLIAGLLCAVGLAVADEALATVYTNGRVLDTNGDPCAGVIVDSFIWSDADQRWWGAGVVLTEADGSYTREMMLSGRYRFQFRDDAGRYVAEWYNNTPFMENAVDVVLNDGDTRTMNAVLDLAGTISGTVTNAGGDPLEGIVVDMFHYYPQTDQWRGCGTVTTGQDGTYAHAGLTPGSTQVLFQDPNGVYAGENYNDIYQGGFTPVQVSGGQTTGGIDASLSLGVTISGYVTGGQFMTPLTGVRVTATRYVEGMGWPGVKDTTTASGAYSLAGMPPGTYSITFDDDSDAYLDEWWNDKHDWSQATAIALTAGQSQGGVNAVLEAPGHIAGTVTGAGGAGDLAGIHVTVHVERGNGQWWPPVAQAWTGADGTYDVGGLLPGDYRVRFGDDAGFRVPEWYPDAASPGAGTDVAVTSGSTAGGIDAELAAGGAIVGTVRNAGGAALQNIEMHVHAWDGDFWRQTEVATNTAADGSFVLGGLAPGAYRVSMRDPGGVYANEVYQDAIVVSAGTDVRVSAGEVTTIAPVLGAAGHVVGQVVGNQMQPLEGINVTFFTWVGGPGGHWEPYVGTQTAANGFFDQGRLFPGPTVVQFSDQSDVFIGEFFDNAPTPDQATQVTVTAGQSNPLGVITLDQAGSIAGRVTDGDSDPLPSIVVDVFRWNDQAQEWQGCGTVTTAQDGTYRHGGLRAGMHQVQFRDPSGAYVNETYDDMPPGGQQGCTQVQVNDGQSVTGIDAALALGASISGMVTDSVGVGLSGISVWAERHVLDQYGGGWQGVTGTSTESGVYELKGLPPGTYRVTFRDEGGTYVQEWWDDHYTDWAADTYDLQAGDTLSGINASLIVAGHIAGAVTGEGAGPLPGVKVSVNAFNGQWYDWVADAFTDGDGAYDVGGLAPGVYRLYFEEQGTGFWASEWYVDATNPDEAVDVAVESGLTTAPVDAELAPGGSISGTVRNEHGESLAGIDVGVALLRGEDWWDWMGSVQTAADGAYRIGGLRPGTYQLEINDWSGTYAVEVYENARNFGAGIDVPVIAGQDTGGIDPVLGLGGRVVGRVVDEVGQPLAGIQIRFEAWVHDPEGARWEWYTETYTGPDGRFDMAGLVAQKTLVHVVDESRAYASEYYDDSPTEAGALPVLVTATQFADIGDVVLAAPGGVSGAVTNAAGDPLEGCNVMFALWNPQGWYDPIEMNGPWPQTDAQGHYDMGGLEPGRYQVWAEDTGGTYVMDVVPEVTVTSGTTTSGTDITMWPGAWVQGTVTDPSGNPVAGVNVGVGYGDRGDGRVTGPDGTYRIGPLGAGSITIGFEPPQGSGLRPEWWDNRISYETAEWAQIDYGEVLTCDAVLGPDSDVDPPETLVSGADGQWHASPVTLTLTGGDIGSGVATTQYRIDGGEWTSGASAEVGAPSDHGMDGAHTVWYRSIDNVGNLEDAQSVEVKIDTTGPMLHGDNGDVWYRTAVTVNLDGTDAGEGTVGGIEYRLPNGDWTAGTSFTMRTWKRGGGSGEHLVDVRAVDGLGNVSDPQQVTVRLDARPPRTTDDYDGLPHGDDVTVHFTMADPLSGGLRTYFSVDAGPWLTGSQVTIPAVFGGGNDGEHLIRFFSVDKVGNVETVIRTRTVMIDTTG